MHVTVCICTRNRGDSIARTLQSVARSDHEGFDVVVVDQSTCDDTARAVRRATKGDPRFTYIRSDSVGASVARNVAVKHARGPLVAFTDDDCEVPPDWLARIVAYFREHADVGEVCGEVRSGAHDPTSGFIPDYRIARLERISSPWLKWRAGGIGANMALRLDILRAVGPFDEMLSPGASLYAYEDGDMTYRVLKAGYTVLNVPDAYVIHHGFRTWEQGQVLMRRTGLGVGAGCMKHLRLGDVAILPTLIYEWGRCISWRRLLLLQHSSGLARFIAFNLGFAASFRHRIDRQKRIYCT